jgi:hypothetical protein
MMLPFRSALGLTSAAALAVLAACAQDPATAPQASRTMIPAVAQASAQSDAASLPSGERLLGQSLIEPAYDDRNSNLIYLATPLKSPFPTHTSSRAVDELYLVEYPPGTTVTAFNCKGVPGNCPDHDLDVATAATQIMPSVYGTNPNLLPGHNHLVAGPGGSEFNVAWEVVEILFTKKSAANTLLTTKDDVEAAIARGDAIEVDLGFAFHCSVVSAAAYFKGTPVN